MLTVGNTCYMSSALQFIGHCDRLTKYFQSNLYESELQREGQIARAYAKLLLELFRSDGGEWVDPHELKSRIDKFNPDFSDHGQKDVMDFLCTFLDGLHEELNRVVNKPYKQRTVTVGVEPSPEQLEFLANEAWKYYRSRDDSIIIDHCRGMLRPTTECGRCDGVAVTFDPFLDIALPLPKERFVRFYKLL